MSKKFTKIMISLLMAFSMIVTPMMPVHASDLTGKEPQNIENTSNVIRRSYYDPNTFSFTESNTGNVKWYSGGHMACEITTSSDYDGLKMHMTAVIIGKGSVSWDVPVDGKMHKKDWISLGTSSGRNVYFIYSCAQNPNARITVHNKSYSW